MIEQLRAAQPTLREQIAVQLLGRLGLRKNELRLLKVKDFDLGEGTFLVRGKGGKVVVMPIGFTELAENLLLELSTRDPEEYLLHPKWDKRRPFDPSALHLHFKQWLERAGLSSSIKMHELQPRTTCGVRPETWCLRSNSYATDL